MKNPQAELGRLKQEAFLTEEQASAVNLDAVQTFFASPLAERIMKSPHVLREYRFTIEVPASRLDASLPPELGKEPVVVQGAVDCAFEEGGAMVLLDFKTDHYVDSAQLLERYKPQLALYREALTQCTGLPVKECLLYAFSTGKTIQAE